MGKPTGDTSMRHASPQAVQAVEFTRRRRILGYVNLAVMTVLLLGVVVVLNLIAREHATRINWTADKIEELAPETVSRLKAVDVEFGIFLNEWTLGAGGQDKSLHEAWRLIGNLVKEFARHNPRIRVSIHGEDAPPAWTQQGQLVENTIYLYCRGLDGRENRRTFHIRELYTGDPTTGEIFDWRAEVRLISAVHTMVRADRKLVYHTEGHDETRPDDPQAQGLSLMLSWLRERDNVEFKRLPRTGRPEVPRDADAVFIPGPRRDFSLEEIEGLKEYLEAGGRLFVALEPLASTPQLSAFLTAWGARVYGEHPLVYDRQCIGNQPLFIHVKSFGNHEINADLTSAPDASVDVPVTTAVAPQPPADKKLKVASLMRTSSKDNSFVDVNKDGRPGTDEPRGPIDIAVAVQSEPVAKPRNAQRPTAKLVVWGSVQVFNNKFNSMPFPSYGPAYYLANWRWLLELEQVVTTDAKRPLPGRPPDLGAQGLKQIAWIVFGLLPTIGIVLGVFAWWFRRK